MSDTTHTAPDFRRNLTLFLLGAGLLGCAGGMFETTFNNFVSDTFQLGADARGYLEFPRELPGFLTALFAGMLFFLPETRVAAAAALGVAGGLAGLAVFGVRWVPMLMFMILWSTGTHLLMPLRASLSMALASKGARGRRLGEIRAVGIGASMVGCSIVWIGMKYLGAGYSLIFTIGSGAAVLAALAFYRMRMPGAHLRRSKFVWRKRYWLFYVLELLFGARKQIFITFGPWVLVRIFRQEAYIFAQLWLVASLLGLVLQPLIGRAVDRFGPRIVLMAAALCIIVVCCGYGFSHMIHDRTVALAVLFTCFVGDQLLFGANMAKEIYLAQIAETPADVAPTLSLGVTINHAVSMSVPALGGVVWMAYGHQYVFIGAAGVAVLIFVFSAMLTCPPAGEQG